MILSFAGIEASLCHVVVVIVAFLEKNRLSSFLSSSWWYWSYIAQIMGLEDNMVVGEGTHHCCLRWMMVTAFS